MEVLFMRNLATIQTIKSLDKIEGRDKIVYASFENVGFRVITSIDRKVGERVIYIECDSILPVKPEYEFLRSRCFSNKWNGFRIRNMRMAGLYSEGLILPCTLYGDAVPPDGTDVTEALGITKYDPEAAEERVVAAQKKSNWAKRLLYKAPILKRILDFFIPKERHSWPKWAQKSDETRAQSLPYIFEKYHGEDFIATEKMDGQSCLYGLVKGKFVVCSRNFQVTTAGGVNNYWKYALECEVEKTMRAMRKNLGYDFYLQGELCGTGIQGNKYGFGGLRYFVFNMRDLRDGSYVDYFTMKDLCKEAGIEVVPFISGFKWDFKNMDELLSYADGKSMFGKDVLREGLVFRSAKVSGADQGQANMRSFKAISPSFDLKWSK